MLHDLFTRGIDIKTGKLRPKYRDAPDLYKESDLGWIPKEWDIERLDSLTEKIGSGITPTGGSEIYETSGVLFIRSQNVLVGSLSIENAAYITNEIDEMMQASRVKPFDILLNITGASIGRCSYFPLQLKSANVNQHVCIIRFLNTSKKLSVFASEFLNSDFGQSQINRLNAGGNREGLNFQQIKSFTFPVVDSNEIQMISNIILTITKKLNTEQTYLQKLQMIKSGLMNDLLSGTRLVSVPNELETETSK
jgi:type I restriction enzyme S subunit